MSKEIWVCDNCKIIPYEKECDLGFHVIPEHGLHDDNGECYDCPVPAQCGRVIKYVVSSELDAAKKLLDEAKDAMVSIEEYWNGGNESAVDAIEHAKELSGEWLTKYEAFNKGDE